MRKFVFKKFLLIVSLVSLSFALEYPFSSWGQISFTDGDLENGVECSGSFEQGINWAKFNIFTFNTFIGVKPSICDNEDYFWKNKLNPCIGFKVKQRLNLQEEFWSGLEYGIKYEYNNYFSEERKLIDGTNSFINFGLGANLQKNNNMFFNNFPLSSWMSLNFVRGDIKESDWVFSGSIQQGVNICTVNNYTLKVFTGYRFTHSDNEDPWNNKIGLISGLEVNTPFTFGINEGIWGSLAVDFQYQIYRYTKTNKNDESQISIAFLWSFGGNLEKILKGRN